MCARVANALIKKALSYWLVLGSTLGRTKQPKVSFFVRCVWREESSEDRPHTATCTFTDACQMYRTSSVINRMGSDNGVPSSEQHVISEYKLTKYATLNTRHATVASEPFYFAVLWKCLTQTEKRLTQRHHSTQRNISVSHHAAHFHPQFLVRLVFSYISNVLQTTSNCR